MIELSLFNKSDGTVSRARGSALTRAVSKSTAFAGQLDGAHTLTQTTNLTALQEFGLLYLFLAGDNQNGKAISGIPGAATNALFEVVTPLFNGNGGPSLNSMNGEFGNAAKNFHH